MNILSQLILPGLLIISLIVPGAYAVSFVLTGESSGETGTDGFAVSAGKDALVKGSISANGAIVNPIIDIIGLGDLKENHQVTDTDGNHAEIHAEVVRGRNIHYENSLAPGEGLVTSTGSVLAKQNLIVSNSNYIKCSQSAYNSAGNKASSGIEIVHGESTNYQGSASAATIGDVLARQTLAAGRFDYTKGIQTVADGQYFSGIEIDHGLLTNYEGIASYQFSVASRISGSDQTLTTGKSNYIKCSQHASDSAGNKANTDLEIDHGYLTNYHGGAGSFAGHYGSYSIDASQAFDDVNGKQIEIKDLASDLVKTGEAHLNIKDGKISEYSGGITAYFHGMHNRNYGPLMDSSFIEASGKDIEIRTSSSDPLIGKSSARIEVKDGILRNSLVGSGWTEERSMPLWACRPNP